MGPNDIKTSLRRGPTVILNILYMRENIKIQQGSAHIFAVFLHIRNFYKVNYKGMVPIKIIELEA
jgi:hypothetical protein